METAAYVQTHFVPSATKRNDLLFAGGCFSLAFAVFQISAILWPASVLRYFGGPVTMQATRPGAYAGVCIGIGVIVALFGIYALSGAGSVRRLPWLRTVVAIITAIYLLRGLQIISDLMLVHKYPARGIGRFAVFSALALVVGLVHLGGTIQLFRAARQ